MILPPLNDLLRLEMVAFVECMALALAVWMLLSLLRVILHAFLEYLPQPFRHAWVDDPSQPMSYDEYMRLDPKFRADLEAATRRQVREAELEEEMEWRRYEATRREERHRQALAHSRRTEPYRAPTPRIGLFSAPAAWEAHQLIAPAEAQQLTDAARTGQLAEIIPREEHRTRAFAEAPSLDKELRREKDGQTPGSSESTRHTHLSPIECDAYRDGMSSYEGGRRSEGAGLEGPSWCTLAEAKERVKSHEEVAEGVRDRNERLNLARWRGESRARDNAALMSAKSGRTPKSTNAHRRTRSESDARIGGPKLTAAATLPPAVEHKKDPYYKDLRLRARAARDKMQRMHEAAAAATRQGKHRLADHNTTVALTLQGNMEELDAEASSWIYHKNNSLGDHPRNVIDLHGLYVSEACFYTELALAQARELSTNILHFIVGQGKHSTNGEAKIKPAVMEMLRSQDICVIANEHNPGRFLAILPDGCEGGNRYLA